MGFFSSRSVLGAPVTGSSLFQLLVLIYPMLPISGQLINSDTAGSWQWPSASFLLSATSLQKSQVKSDSQVPSFQQFPDTLNSNGQTSTSNTFPPGSLPFLPAADFSSLSTEYQPNSEASPPANFPLVYPAYPSGQAKYQSDTLFSSPSNPFSNPNLNSESFSALSPDFLRSFSQPSTPSKPNFPSFQSEGESELETLVQQVPLARLSSVSSSSSIQSKPNYQTPLVPPLHSDVFASSSPFNIPLANPVGLKLLPEEQSSPFFSFPNNDDSALFSPEPSSPHYQPSGTQDFISYVPPFSPDPIPYFFPPSKFPRDFDSPLYSTSSDLFSIPSFASQAPFENFPLYNSESSETSDALNPPFSLSSASGVPGTSGLTPPPSFPDLFVHTPDNSKPFSGYDNLPPFPGDKFFDLLPPPPKVSEPCTFSPESESMSQIMTSYMPELPTSHNYEPPFSQIPSPFESSGGLVSLKEQSEPQSFIIPSDIDSKQPSHFEPGSSFPNLFNQEPQPTSEGIVPRIGSEGVIEECPVNERYLKCGPSCPRTCQNFIQNLKCDKKECKAGCFCKRGFIRNKYGTCVRFRKCNPAICRRHEVFRPCGSKCQTTCGNYGSNLTCDSDECVRGCFCRNGFVRRRDGRCIQPHHCKIGPKANEKSIANSDASSEGSSSAGTGSDASSETNSSASSSATSTENLDTDCDADTDCDTSPEECSSDGSSETPIESSGTSSASTATSSSEV